MRHLLRALALCGPLLLTVVVASPIDAGGRRGRADFDVSVARAPVAPDGDVAGALTDLVATFADIDPSVDGIGLRAGGTIRVTLPPQFVNRGVLPVATTGSAEDCEPPLVSGCSTAVILQGWPQSPVPPFPTVTWEPDTNTVVLTAQADWGRNGPDLPGPKQVHLMLFGFTNPERPGSYPIRIEIQTDPASDEVLRGRGRIRILPRPEATIGANSQANGGPPPPFPNPLFQTVAPGDSSLTMAFYLWDRNTDALVGVDFGAGNARVRPLLDVDGHRVGTVRVRPPKRATAWSLTSGGPSQEVAAFITGLPTGRLTAVLDTDPAAAGTYRLRFALFGGNTVEHVIRAG